MAHEVETMAYAGDVPWHGLGVSVSPELTDQEMLQAAGLDWEVEKLPLYFERGGERQEVPNLRALVRSTDSRLLSTVGREWKPVQNREAMRFFRSFVEAGDAQMETAGSLYGGKMVWGLARLRAGFTLPGGDEVRGYVLLASPHESGKATIARVVSTRVVCANTMRVAVREGVKFEGRFVHRQEFDPVAAREAMGLACDAIVEFGDLSQRLQATVLSWDKVIETYVRVYQPEAIANDDLAAITSGRLPANQAVLGIVQAYKMAPGAEEGTAWGVLNGATYWHDHVAGKSPDARLASSWLGRGDAQKQALLSELVKLAA